MLDNATSEHAEENTTPAHLLKTKINQTNKLINSNITDIRPSLYIPLGEVNKCRR